MIKKLTRSQLILITLALLTGVILLVHLILVRPSVSKINAGFEYRADLISSDNFFDTNTDSYQGQQSGQVQFGYDDSVKIDDLISVNNYFILNDDQDETKLEITRNLLVEPVSGEHAITGDKFRLGYMIAPRFKGPYAQIPDKSSFTYWHVNYDNPIYMDFVQEETLFGLEVYLYESNFTADQTKELDHLPKVGESLEIVLDVNFKVWIEPTTGYMVKYKDKVEGFYVDKQSGQRLYPWNKYSNHYTTQSVIEHVNNAYGKRLKLILHGWLVPIFLFSLLLILIAFIILGRFSIGDRRKKYRSKFFTPLVVLLLTSGLTLGAWSIVNNYVDQKDHLEFETLVTKYNDSLLDKLNSYVGVLNSARGFLYSSESVTRSEWKSYVESIDLEKNYPGIQGLGYAIYLQPNEVDDHVKKMEQEFSNFSLRPEGDRKLYSSIMYIEPFNARNQQALGYDMYSEQTRRLAMIQSRDLDQPALSGKVTLVQEIDDKVQAGFIIYVPVYKNKSDLLTISDRRENIVGYIYAAFRAGDFVQSSLDLASDDLNLEIFDSASVYGAVPDRLLYSNLNQTNPDQISPDQLMIQKSIEAAGRTWITSYTSKGKNSDFISRWLPHAFLIGGLGLSILLTILVYVLNTRRAKAVSMADRITHQLRIHQERLETFNRIVTLPKLGFVQRIEKTLELATNELGLTIGIVSNVQGQRYLVKHVYSNDEKINIETDSEFKLRDMYCNLTLKAKDVFTISDVVNSEHRDHSCYEKTGLTSYIGVPIFVQNNRYGTLNFSSPYAHKNFTDEDRQFVQLVGLWLGRILEDQLIDKGKTEFVSTASHQLRTPLTAIGWNAELLLSDFSDNLDENQRALLSEIDLGKKRMVDLVNSLLNISRIELNTFRIEPVEVDINEIVTSLIKEMQSTISKKSLDLTTEIDPDIDRFVADPGMLRIILQNLLSNAIKYTPQDGKVEIKVVSTGRRIMFKVKDNGLGIPVNDQPHLFNKFYRADNAIKESIEGTGLGLYIIKSILESSGGQIKFKSSPGKGTEFTVIYPKKGMRSKSGTKDLS